MITSVPVHCLLVACIQQEDLMASSTEQTNMDSILTQLPDKEERSPEQLDLDKPPPVNNDEV